MKAPLEVVQGLGGMALCTMYKQVELSSVLMVYQVYDCVEVVALVLIGEAMVPLLQ